MKCDLCGSRDGLCGSKDASARKLAKRSFFSIRLSKDFKKHFKVPCYAVRRFNKATGALLFVKTLDGERYKFNIVKSEDSACLFGAEYKKFLIHYNMKHGERIRLDMGSHSHFMPRIPIDMSNHDKLRVDGKFDFTNSAKAVVVSKDLKLTNVEIARVNKVVRQRGLGLKIVFVHKITKSDIGSNCLHIPKVLVKAMGIQASGEVQFVGVEGAASESGFYHISTDGRMRFRSGWVDFARGIKLAEKYVVVVVMFKKITSGIQVSVDRVRLAAR